MPTRPDTIPIKDAIACQHWCYGLGALLSFLSFGAFSAADGGAGLILGGIAAALFYGGSKIKTHKRWKGSVDVYK